MPPRLLLLLTAVTLAAQSQPLPPPGFHHLHLNSTVPDAAIDFYTRQFPSATRTTFAGQPALKIATAYILFTKVKTPPLTAPQSALWHFGWHVPDVHQSLAQFQQRPEVHLLPLFTTEEGGTVFTSADTWPGANGSLGRTKSEIAEAKAQGLQPTHGAGFAYMEGPDHALIEYQGNLPAERFNHVHMYQKDPYCAELWYRDHLNAPSKSTYTMATCKVPRPEPGWPSLDLIGTRRQPAAVTFDGVAFTWHVQQNDTPLVSSRGQVMDHIALSVPDLTPWLAKLRSEGVKFLRQPYKLGGMRAVMIEGPSREAIELIEAQKRD
jgi:catechol 2,3-dioxygenase-like lactoylglutathione lyase family enzyme